jgi:MFS transporter, DHA1 family, inner membrane transport protein
MLPLAVLALYLAAFCIGTTEFIVSGILLGVSSDLGVSVPTAGLLVTGYAAGVAVGGPVLALLTARVPIKPATLSVIAIFAVGQVFCALAPNYELLLAARLISACGHGVFFGVASVAVSRLVPVERRGAALSLMVGGITVANILGLPAGTAIGNAFGWRATFVVIAVMAALAVVAVALTLPRETAGEEEADAPLRVQARQLLHQEVWLSYLTIAIIMIGQLAFGTFQVAILTEITKLDPIVMVPVYLLIGGAGAVIGIWLGGRAADWNGAIAIITVCVGQIVCFALLLLVAGNAVGMAIALFLGSAFGFGFSTPIQVRILHGAREAPRLAATMVSTAYNVGIAAGAAVGAALLTAGVSYAMLPVTGLVTSTLALATASISIALSRRGIA